MHVGRWRASDHGVAALEDAGWYFRHGNIEAGNCQFDRAGAYYSRVVEVAGVGWWGSHSKEFARALLNLVRRAVEYYTRLMGDKEEHLRAVAEDYGLPVEVARRALEAAAEMTTHGDTRLSRLQVLQARYEKRLRELVLPPGGFTTKAQADAGATLGSTLRELQKLQDKLGLPMTETPERVLQAAAMASAYRGCHDKKTGALGRSWRSCAAFKADFRGLTAIWSNCSRIGKTIALRRSKSYKGARGLSMFFRNTGVSRCRSSRRWSRCCRRTTVPGATPRKRLRKPGVHFPALILRGSAMRGSKCHTCR